MKRICEKFQAQFVLKVRLQECPFSQMSYGTEVVDLLYNLLIIYSSFNSVKNNLFSYLKMQLY